jgi:hypothetical protein
LHGVFVCRNDVDRHAFPALGALEPFQLAMLQESAGKKKKLAWIAAIAIQKLERNNLRRA